MHILLQQKIRNTLEVFGLTHQEITVYLEMLVLGSVPVSVVAKRLKLTRSTIRYTLEKLVRKKLLIQSQKNKTFYFTPEDPEKIIRVLQDKKLELDHQESAINSVLDDLKSLQNPLKNLPKVQYFEGEDGLIAMYERLLADIEAEPLTIFGYAKVTPSHVYPAVWDYLKNVYTPRRRAAGNQAFMIYPQSMKETAYTEDNESIKRTCAYVPESAITFSTGFHVYGDKIAHFTRQPGEHPGGILIENPRIAQDQRQLFKMAWGYSLTFESNQGLREIDLPDR